MLRSWGERGGQRDAGRSGERADAVVSVAVYLDPWDALRRELDRARRYGRPLALIQVAPAGAKAQEEAKAPRRRFFSRGGRGVDTVALLRSELRTGDEVWRVHERIFVLLPEADHFCAAALLDRLRARLAPVMAGCDVRMVSFPGDGLTAGALLAGLGGQQARRRTVAAVARPAGPREVLAAPRGDDEPWQRRSRRSWSAP